MGRSPIPFFLWALPFLIRANQCIVSSRNTSDQSARMMHRINFVKYLTALPVVLFSFLYAREPGSLGVFIAADIEAFIAMTSAVNTIFSFSWDVFMDWGFMHPGCPPATLCAPSQWGYCCLRPVLLYRGTWGFYHTTMLVNLIGRLLWTLRWSEEAKTFMGA